MAQLFRISTYNMEILIALGDTFHILHYFSDDTIKVKYIFLFISWSDLVSSKSKLEDIILMPIKLQSVYLTLLKFSDKIHTILN